MAENKDYITRELDNGTVNINEEVLSTIAAAAVKDVEGVVGLNGNLSVDIAGFLGRRSAGKGIKITLNEDSVQVDCNLVVLYGHSVLEIARNVQNVVTNAIESMTGLHVEHVDVNICAITMAKA